MHALYQFFYRQFGVRRLQQLVQPRLVRLESLPKNSILHYLSHDGEHPELDTSKLYLNDYGSKRIMTDFALDIKSVLGNPRKVNGIIRDITKDFFKQHKNYKYLPEAYKITPDGETLVVINYNYLDVLYKYSHTPLEAYHRWFNTESTRFKNIADISDSNERNHFVFVDVPAILPSWNLLNTFSDRADLTYLRIFSRNEDKFILEFWKWLNPKYKAISIFKDLDESKLSKVNIVFTSKNGESAVLNLGYLSSWVAGSKNLTEFNRVDQLDYTKIQKLFLKFLITLNTVNEEPEELPTEIDSTKPDTIDEIESEEASELEDTGMYSGATDKAVDISKVSDKDLDAVLAEEDDIDKHLADIDQELATLDTISKRQLQVKGIKLGDVELEEPEVDETKPIEELQAMIYGEVSYTDALQAQLDKQADYGLISAGDYKKLLTEAKAYPTKKDPYGKNRTIGETIDIKLEDLTLDKEKNTIVASDIVKDKSMLTSSLQSFDSSYIEKMMDRHVVSTIASLQRAGIVIRNHEVEIDNSILGTYENHTLEIRPIDGQPSTLHFRIAKVDPDGTFVSSNVKYKQRLQRADCPIRKISPGEVALSSYYGKTFVNLSPKRVDDPVAWLVKKITEASLIEDSPVSKVAPANVFDNNFKAPYMYGAMSNHFKGFKAGNLNLTFDHHDRLKYADQDTLAKIETNGSVLVGFTDTKKPVLMDKDSKFLVYQDGKLDLIGDIYHILGLQASDSPLPFSEVRIFSKTLPVGIILAYTLGFGNLIKFLKAEFRIVEGRKQKMMGSHQFAITFQDKSYIFSRDDKVSALILGGFIEFEKQIKSYPASEFNKKDVYLNLLESKGLGSLYIREIELTDQLFIDPITKTVLEKMKEPTTFRGLLVRSTELLTTYYHPDTQDMSVMRIKGYERFSGALYKEMVTSIRQYKNSNFAGKSKVNMSPYQVWNGIAKDASIKIVEDTNPIQNLKEQESITYVGEGGRSKDSMSKPTRAYHLNDMGVVSEATVDSSDVGVNAYLSANPNLTDMLGTISETKDINPTSLLSTSALISPAAVHDDQYGPYM